MDKSNVEMFLKSVDILFDAYEKGNLKHMSPCNCAVGNLIAYNTGTYNFTSEWASVINVIRSDKIDEDGAVEELLKNTTGSHFKDQLLFKGSRTIVKTGYTPLEIERIERAFEKNGIQQDCNLGNVYRGSRSGDDPFDGLIKAVKALGDIHNIESESLGCVVKKIEDRTYVKTFEFRTPNPRN